MFAGYSLADYDPEVAEPQSIAAYQGLKIRPFEERDRAEELLKQHHENTVFRSQPFSKFKYNEKYNRIVYVSFLILYILKLINMNFY